MTAPESPQKFDPRWRLALAVAGVLLGLIVFRLSPRGSSDRPAPQQPLPGQQGTVTLLIRRPEVEPTQVKVPWSAGITVAEATRRGLTTEWQGEGEMAMLTSLSGLANQGADGLNWQFEVNGEYATRGAGAVRLRPGDRVLWKLAPYE